jgi:hypothetical protein
MVAVTYPDGPAVRLRRQRIEVDKKERPPSLVGQKRRFDPLPATSGLPRSTDIIGPAR